MSQTFTTYAPFIKEMVLDHEDECYAPSPALALIPKNTAFFGSSLRVPLKIEDVQASGAGFAQAQTAASAGSSVEKAFSVTHVTPYSLGRISGSLLRRAEKNVIVDALDNEVSSAMQTLSCDISHQLYRAGFGSRGVITGVSGSTFQMTNADDIAHIKLGMYLHFSDSESGDALRSSTTVKVTAIDEETNTVTCSATMASVSAVNGDYVFRAGDREDSATPARLVYCGMQGWIPASVTSASFFGVDRTANRTRLAGSYWAASTTPPEDVLITGLYKLARRGGKASHAFCPPGFFAALTRQLQSRGQVPLVDVKVNPKVGFRGIDLVSPSGNVTVLPDIYCPADTVWITNVDSWELATAGKMVRLADEDGLERARLSDADTYEFRFVSEGNLACRKPIDNIHINITAYS